MGITDRLGFSRRDRILFTLASTTVLNILLNLSAHAEELQISPWVIPVIGVAMQTLVTLREAFGYQQWAEPGPPIK